MPSNISFTQIKRALNLPILFSFHVSQEAISKLADTFR